MASSLDYAYTLIILSGGNHDIALTSAISKSVHIRGLKRGHTRLVNTQSTTEVIEFSDTGKISHLSIHATGIQDGIVLSGARQFRIEAVNINCTTVTGAQNAVLAENTANGLKMVDVRITGTITRTTGIHLNGCRHGYFNDILTRACLVGVHLENAADDENYFEHIALTNCTTGLHIEAAGATDNFFEHVDLTQCTTSIDDTGTHTDILTIHTDSENATVAPDNLTGIPVTAGGAGVWTAVPVQLRSAAAATSPFYVSGMTYEIATQERFQVRLSDDGGTTHFWSGVVEERVASRTKWLIFSDRFLVRQGTAIHAEVRSETGGNNCIIWLHITEI
ncbi:hypothetical protein ES703_109892 [subsurface metagenome]